MSEKLLPEIANICSDFAVSCDVSFSIFDWYSKTFLKDYDCHFCKSCSYFKEGRCFYTNTHKYGFFEADRWDGLYIYYCPLGLTFISAIVYSQREALLSLVLGPIVMSAYPETVSEIDNFTSDNLNRLPLKTPTQVSSIAKTQKILAAHLSNEIITDLGGNNHSKMNNSMYDVIMNVHDSQKYNYPFDIEQKLQKMITNGDKQGAQELINDLLGQVYFKTGGDFELLKARAYELVVLFSRAAIEGGADTQQIFGHNQDIMLKINRFTSIYDLSDYLSTIFYRFVGYVFDFDQVQHSDIMHKAINFIKENYTSRITLQDVANHVYLSKSYFSKLFKEEISTSFTDYVNNVRINKSKELLLGDSLSLSDISTLVGFSDQSYFTKVFVKSTGVSPGQYKKTGGKAKKIRS